MKSNNKTALPVAAALSLCAANVFAQQGEDEHHILDEVVVTTTPLNRTVEQLAQPTSVLGSDALTRRQSSSIGEAIADQPGVTASYFGPVASRPVIRGQFGERVRVLSNGLDALDASALSEDHAVSLDAILADRVEIVRGPATLLYGSGAAGGLVNIVDSRIHSSPLQNPFGGAVSLSTDSAAGAETAAVRLDGGTESVALHMDYFSRETDNLEIPDFAESFVLRELEGELDGEPEGFVENSDSDTEGAAGAVTWHGSHGYIGIAVSSYDSNYGVPGHHHEEEHEEGEEESEEEEEEEIVRIDLDQTRIDVKGELRLTGFLEAIRFRFADNDYEHVELEGDEIGTMFDTQGTDGRIEFRHGLVNGFEGAFGVQYTDIDFMAIGDEAFVPSSVNRQLSLFAFEEFTINNRWTLQGSARIENQELEAAGLPRYDETAFGASVGLVWNVNDRISWAANLGLTERHPTATELYADGPHIAVQRFERGALAALGTAFETEKSSNLDVTFRARLERLEINLTGFINIVDDYILLRPSGDEEDGFQVFNYAQDDVEMYGFEAEALFDIFDSERGHLHARFNSDYVFAEEKASGAYLARIPPLRFGMGLHYIRNAFEAGIEAKFYDDQTKVAANELPTDSYALVNIEASYRLLNDKLLIFAKGSNLGDEDARRHSSALKDLVPLPGRSLHLGLRWDF